LLHRRRNDDRQARRMSEAGQEESFISHLVELRDRLCAA
jgi:hypothetical protein